MKVSEGKVGRVFVVRLEDGDRLPDAIEDLAKGYERPWKPIHLWALLANALVFDE